MEFNRQCPLCQGADQHRDDCQLNGKPHIYSYSEGINWDATLRLNAPLGPAIWNHRIAFRDGPTMAQVTYAEFLSWVADRLEHVYGDSPNMDFMRRLRELAASVVPADADSPSTSEPVTPEMIAAGFRVLNKAKVRLGPGPCLKDAYMAMRAARPKA